MDRDSGIINVRMHKTEYVQFLRREKGAGLPRYAANGHSQTSSAATHPSKSGYVRDPARALQHVHCACAGDGRSD